MVSSFYLSCSASGGRARSEAAKYPARNSFFASTTSRRSHGQAFGLLILLFYPFDGALLSRFAVVTALPYFWAMASDLKRIGYRWMDVLGVYGFNLILLPVNLAGTVALVAQAIGGQKMAFARTPKVQNRTVAPIAFLTLPVFVVVWSMRALTIDFNHHAYVHGAFASVNFFMTLYAVLLFIGIGPLVVDLAVNARSFVYRPRRAPTPAPTGAALGLCSLCRECGSRRDRSEWAAGSGPGGGQWDP